MYFIPPHMAAEVKRCNDYTGTEGTGKTTKTTVQRRVLGKHMLHDAMSLNSVKTHNSTRPRLPAVVVRDIYEPS